MRKAMDEINIINKNILNLMAILNPEDINIKTGKKYPMLGKV